MAGRRPLGREQRQAVPRPDRTSRTWREQIPAVSTAQSVVLCQTALRSGPLRLAHPLPRALHTRHCWAPAQPAHAARVETCRVARLARDGDGEQWHPIPLSPDADYSIGPGRFPGQAVAGGLGPGALWLGRVGCGAPPAPCRPVRSRPPSPRALLR